MEKVKLEMKFSFPCSPKDLYLAITQPTYLQNWIAERVEFDQPTGVYTFHWTTFSESAKIAENDPNKFIKWDWVERDGEFDDGEYVSFRIDEIKGDDLIDLYIEDFCERNEKRQLREGWEKQMHRLERLVK